MPEPSHVCAGLFAFVPLRLAALASAGLSIAAMYVRAVLSLAAYRKIPVFANLYE